MQWMGVMGWDVLMVGGVEVLMVGCNDGEC